MIELFCLLEEPSAKEMLKVVVPKIAPGVLPICIPFEGKQDLEKNLTKKIRGWQNPDARFLVLRDQDAGDCHTVKEKLLSLVKASGKEAVTIVRIACHELEAFYLGDLQAVEAGLGISGLAAEQKKEKFRNPDNLQNAKQELRKLTNNQYQAVAGSKKIAPYLRLDGASRSPSFQVLLQGIQKLLNS